MAKDNGNIVQVGCMAHLRCKFYKILEQESQKVPPILNQIKLFYKIERDLKESDLQDEQKLKYRVENASPILDELENVFNLLNDTVLPASNFGKAVTYALNQLPKIKQYLKDIQIQIDNNFSERCVKTLVIGRKNWIFAHNHDTAKRHMTLYIVF